MGADYSFELNSIETYAPQFLGHNNLFLGSVGWWKKSKKSINVEGGFFLWRVEFFKIGKRDFTFIRELRVH
jgi:hypothetical protein